MNTNKKILYFICTSLLFASSINFAASQQEMDLMKQRETKAQTQQTANDVIIILDPEENETKDDSGAMTLHLIIALQEKAAPIIVTKELVANVCFLIKTIGTDNLTQMRELLKNSTNTDEILKKSDEIAQKLSPDLPVKEKKSIIQDYLIPITSAIDLDNNNWHGYTHKTENLILLIPRAYIDNNKQGDIKKCGFALDSLIKIPNLSPNELNNFLEQRETTLEITDAFIKALESMFIQNNMQPILRITREQQKTILTTHQTENEEKRESSAQPSSWNIYFTGHGDTPTNKKQLLKNVERSQTNITKQQQKLEKLQQQSLQEFEELNKEKQTKSLQDVELWQGYVADQQINLEKLQKLSPKKFEKEIKEIQKQLEEYQGYLKDMQLTFKKIARETSKSFEQTLESTQAQLKKYEKSLENSKKIAQKAEIAEIAQKAKGLPVDQIIPGMIAGLEFPDFLHFMKFLERNIKTSFLHYRTCFGGGVNQAFLNDQLKKLNASFIVSAEGISETSTFVIMPKPYFSGGKWIFSSLRFNIFFKLLNEFFGNSFTQAKKEITAWKHDPLKAIMQSIVPQYGINPYIESVANAPFIRFPSAGVFSAMNVDTKMKILTNSVVRAYELEGEPIDLSDTDIEYIIVYPHRVGVTLNMGGVAKDTGYQKAIILPTPTEFSPSYKAIGIFEKIIFEETLSSFLFHLVSHNTSIFKKTFLIKELECWDYENSGLGIGQGKKIVIKNMIALLSPEQKASEKLEHEEVVLSEHAAPEESISQEASEEQEEEEESTSPEQEALPEESTLKTAGTLHVCFEFNGMTYCVTMPIPDSEGEEQDEEEEDQEDITFKEFKAEILKEFDSFAALPAEPEIIQNLAREILNLNPEDLAYWPRQPKALLKQLVQTVDNSVEKIVIKPGALKEKLLKQKKIEQGLRRLNEKAARELRNPGQSTAFEKSNTPITPQQILKMANVDLQKLQDMLHKLVIVPKN